MIPLRLSTEVRSRSESKKCATTHKTLKNAPMNHAPRVLSTGICGMFARGSEARKRDENMEDAGSEELMS